MELIVAKLDFSEELSIGAGIERRVGSQKAISNNTDRPHITRLIIEAFKDFWCHVVGSTCFGRHEILVKGIEILG